MEYIKGLKRLTTLTGWRKFFKILSKKEKTTFLVILFLFLTSSVSLGVNFYKKNTEIQPAKGGTLTEGILGQPRYINPLYATSDADRDLVELIFSGLMKYDENGKISKDLAESVDTEEDGKVYIVNLKENIFWSDSNQKDEQKITADDVVFTIKTMQNSDYKSSQRIYWVGVGVEKISDYKIKFTLKNPYAGFLENLTVKILPQHIWQNIPPEQASLSLYNLKPVGSGPYKLESFTKNGDSIMSALLKINSQYRGEKPHLSEVRFRFFEEEKDLISAAKNGEINGFSATSFENSNFTEYDFSMPRYFAVFFNPEKAKILADLKIRKALNYGTDKNELAEKISNNRTRVVDSPILPTIYGFNPPAETYQFDLEKAKSLLKEAGFLETEAGVREKNVQKQPAFQFKSDLQTGSKGTEVEELQKCMTKDPNIYPEGEITGSFGSLTKAAVIRFQEKYSDEILKPSGFTKGTGLVSKATRKKLNELCAKPTEEKVLLKISLVTVNQPTLIETANILKEQWQKMGVLLEIQTFDNISTLERDVIKTRDYEMILFGEALGETPDPFPFWDSAQKKDPGKNLALYENKDADKLLEDARQNLNEQERKEELEKFQDILIKDAPCVFLYSLDYVYFTSKEIKGLKEKMITDPSKRFSNIENWYIKIRRVWK